MGKWVERDPGYLSFDVYNCTYCGKLIPRHIWYEEVDGEEKPFCDEDCHARYLYRRAHPLGTGGNPSGSHAINLRAHPQTEEE